ncbi:unnamed protein product, partial [Prorocentrum cordatum]
MALAVLAGLVREASARHGVRTVCECSMDISVPRATAGSTLPTEQMLWRAVASGAGLTKCEMLPRRALSAWVSRCPQVDHGEDVDAHVMHVQFAVSLPREQEREKWRRQLLRTGWVPHSGLADWQGARVVQRPPRLTRLKGPTLDDSVVDVIEAAGLGVARRCPFRLCRAPPDQVQQGAAPAPPGDLRTEVAHGMFAWLKTARAAGVLAIQGVGNVVAAVILPLYVAGQADYSCEVGYPMEVHLAWFYYMLFSVLSNVALVCVVCGSSGCRLFVRYWLRCGIRLVAMGMLLSSTYQDVVFYVLARTCDYDVWRVAAWLLLFGVGAMQICVQLFMLFRCYLLFRRAQNPEDRERLRVEGIFQALRSSNNLLLTHLVQPALQEHLGGESSWAAAAAEVRIAMARALFQDVEQAALQLVFLTFLQELPARDTLFVYASASNSLLLSFGAIAQLLPEARDWLWHQALPSLPGGRRLRPLRVAWLALCALLLKLALA